MMDLSAVALRQLRRPTVLSDVDNILCYYIEGELLAVNARYGTSYSLDQMTTYQGHGVYDDEQREWIHSWRHTASALDLLAPNYQAIDALTQLHDAGCRIIVASNRPVEMATTTTEWLRKYEVPFDLIFLNGPGSKPWVAKHYGPLVWLDDDPHMWPYAVPTRSTIYTPRREWTPSTPRRGVIVYSNYTDVIRMILSQSLEDIDRSA